MIVTHEREKLINAIVFFAANTKYCGKLKLIKLLYLLDFEHFRQTGRSVTGMDYYAWPLGPVPLELFQEWEEPGSDLAAAIDIVPEQVIDYTRLQVVPRVDFDPGHFTKRELRIMGELADRFREDLSKPLVDVSHVERGPWEMIWDAGKGRNERIPYVLAVPDDSTDREAILEAARHYEALALAWRSH